MRMEKILYIGCHFFRSTKRSNENNIAFSSQRANLYPEKEVYCNKTSNNMKNMKECKAARDR